ncbi:hypothetical protein BsWGS_00015 [Bradybaena similaris]
MFLFFQECPDLKEILQKGDFSEFIEHLQGLQSIYQVTTDEKLKSKAFLALQALEKDLNQLAQFQSSISGVANYIHKCPLGIMLPRLAGKPMKLIYFVSPYDLLDKKSLAAHPLTVEAITENFLGQSVNVCIEAVAESAPANKLQTMPLMSVNKTQDGKSLPSFSAVSKINSTMLPASFVLVLAHSVPVSTQIVQKITSQTCLEIHKEAECRSLRALILETFSGGDIKEDRRLVVSLPDQQHIYFLDCLNGGCQEHQGMMVSRIPFTHPTHVPQILALLRQQLLFNMVIGSCVRPRTQSESSNSIVFEVTAISLQQLTILFEHPAYDSMIRVDIDLTDITNLRCKVVCTNSDQVLCSDEALSRVFHRCMSIPIMLRWLIGKGLRQLDQLKKAALAAERQQMEKEQFLRQLRHQQAMFQPTTIQTNRPPPQPPHPPPLPPPPIYPHYHSPVHIAHGVMNSNGQDPASAEVLDDLCQLRDNKHDRLSVSPDTEPVDSVLIPLLHQEQLSKPKEVHDAPMLSRLLDDNTSVATTVLPMDGKPSFIASAKRSRKRKPLSDSSGPSPKHHLADADFTERFGPLGSSMDLDMMPGVIDHNLHNSPPVIRTVTPTCGSSSHHAHQPLLNRAPTRSQNAVIDLTEDSCVGESSLKRLSDLSMLFNETEAQSRIANIRHNSPSGSKNENASTSLEGDLKGSGEVGRAKDFDPTDAPSGHSLGTVSKLSTLLLAPSESRAPCLGKPPDTANFVFPGQAGCDGPCGVAARTTPCSNSIGQDIQLSVAALTTEPVCQPSSLDTVDDSKSIAGLFDRFDISRQQKPVTAEAVVSQVRSQLVEGKVSLRLKVGPLRQQNSLKAFVRSYKSLDETARCGKANNLATFDFKSDEDDDAPLVHFSSDRFICSSSPMCLQISSKQKQFNDLASIHHKSDKVKKKDKSSGNTTKRKREKDKSKREKKKKKSEHFIEDSVYRTVENDAKGDFKMKIRVKAVMDKSDVFSDGKVPSYEITKKPLASSSVKLLTANEQDKGVHVASEVSREPDGVSDTHRPVPGKSSPKILPCSGSKTDPKLVTKATIRLKPLTLPNCSSTVNIGHPASKSASLASVGHKTERGHSASLTPPISDKRLAVHNPLERKSSTSNLIDRRSVIQPSTCLSTSSSTSTVRTPCPPTTSANLSLSSILPNAPTISKIASLPRIPKLSSLSSNSSISRTSSLDNMSEPAPTSAGTKANNSYTLGPVGRSFPGTTSAPGASRPSLGSSSTFSYGSRPITPGNGSSGAAWSTFSMNRPGCTHRQTNPLINSNHTGLQRPLAPRDQSPSLGHKMGFCATGSHKHGASHTNKKSITEPSGSSASTQKTFGSGTKPISSSIVGSEVSAHFTGHKPHAASAHPGVTQKHASPNTHVSAISLPNNSTGSLNRSPNTDGVTKSPNPGRSPSLNSASKSPNVSTASRSPNSSNNSVKSSASSLTRHRHALGVVTSSHVHKSFMKTHYSSTSHRNSSSVPGSTKSYPTETGGQNHPTANHSPAARGSGSAAGAVSNVPSESSCRACLPSKQSPSACVHRLSAAQPHCSPVLSCTSSSSSSIATSSSVTTLSSSVTTSSLSASLSISKAISVDEAEPSRISPAAAKDTHQLLACDRPCSSPAKDTHQLQACDRPCSSPTALTPLSADGIKNKFHSSSSRGRKSSLSAIVDKLKHSAVGCSLASPGLVPAFAENLAIKMSASCLSVEDVKSSVNSSRTRDERGLSSQVPVSVQCGGESANKHMNHVFGDTQKMAECTDNCEDMAADLAHTDIDSMRTTGTVSSEISVEDQTGHAPKVVIAKHGLDLAVLAEDSATEECSDVTLESSRVKLAAVPLKASLLQQPCPSSQQTSASSAQKSLVASGHSHAASPFHPLQSPSAAMTSSCAVAVSCGRDTDQDKLASCKPPAECLDESSQADTLSVHGSRNSQFHDSRENHIENADSKASGHVDNSQPLSNPVRDIRSPGNDHLVIDDMDGTHRISKRSCKFPASDSIYTRQSTNGGGRQSRSLCLMENSMSCNRVEHAALIACPQTASPSALTTKSPVLAKYPSCASLSDSPCPIDDDLMDMALGFGS